MRIVFRANGLRGSPATRLTVRSAHHSQGGAISYKIPRRAADSALAILPPAADLPPQALRLATAAPPPDLLDGFYSLSVTLTGFSDVELRGTGVGDAYLAWLSLEYAAELDELMQAWSAILRDDPPDRREAALKTAILGDPALGPFARAVLGLWYTATWTPPKSDSPHVFGDAYPEGLMWHAAVGAHPGGAKPTGFGTWAFAPRGT